MEFDRESRTEDYFLQGVIEICLVGREGHAVTKAICENLLTAARVHKAHGYKHVQLMKSLLAIQPEATMDKLFDGGEEESESGKNLIWEASQTGDNPMEVLRVCPRSYCFAAKLS